MDKKAQEYREHLAKEFLNVLKEQGEDWIKGWTTSQPFNAKSNAAYRGLNRFYLSFVAQQKGYKDIRWATFKQIQDMGLRLKNAKGAGVKVEYWFPWDLKNRQAMSWKDYHLLEQTLDPAEMAGRFSLRVKYATVFNGDLIDGLEPMPEPEKHDIVEDNIIDRLSKNMGVEVLNDGGNRAFYRPSEDKIHLPRADQFKSDYAYASTALHEFGHATGAASRLNRNMGGAFGTPEYAYEELIAEITSCFMSANIAVQQDENHIKNHKAYIASWIEMISDKPEKLVKAIAEAERATAYLEKAAGIITSLEYDKVKEATMEVNENRITEEPTVAEEATYYREEYSAAEHLEKAVEAPVEIFVGNLAKYTEGQMQGQWISLPQQEEVLDAALKQILGEDEELIIMDVSVRSDCGYLRNVIGEWDKPQDINVVAKLIGQDPHEAAELFIERNSNLTLEELANVFLQEKNVAYVPYQFSGIEDPQVKSNLSPEEMIGYTLLEADDSLMQQINSINIGTMTLAQYIDVEAIGRDMILSDYVHPGENGFLDLQQQSSIDLSYYKMEEIREELRGMQPKEKPKPVSNHSEKPEKKQETKAPRL